MFGEPLAARLHFKEHVAGPDEIGELGFLTRETDAVFEGGVGGEGIGVVIERRQPCGERGQAWPLKQGENARTTDAKEVGVGNPAEETSCRPGTPNLRPPHSPCQQGKTKKAAGAAHPGVGERPGSATGENGRPNPGRQRECMKG